MLHEVDGAFLRGRVLLPLSIVNPTRVLIEQKGSYRWLENVRQSTSLLAEPERIVHLGDRESDIYELFSIAHQAGSHFLLRTYENVFRQARGREETKPSHPEEQTSSGKSLECTPSRRLQWTLEVHCP